MISMKIVLELEEDCPNCNGSGIDYHTEGAPIRCRVCEGHRKIPTEEGDELLKFIRRYS